MNTTTEPGWTEATVTDANSGKEITFRQSDQPGSLVAVTIGSETVQVRAVALIAAVRLVQLKGEE